MIEWIFDKYLICRVGFGEEMNHQIARRIYPLIVSVVLGASLVVFQAKQFKKLYEHIKNDK